MNSESNPPDRTAAESTTLSVEHPRLTSHLQGLDLQKELLVGEFAIDYFSSISTQQFCSAPLTPT